VKPQGRRYFRQSTPDLHFWRCRQYYDPPYEQPGPKVPGPTEPKFLAAYHHQWSHGAQTSAVWTLDDHCTHRATAAGTVFFVRHNGSSLVFPNPARFICVTATDFEPTRPNAAKSVGSRSHPHSLGAVYQDWRNHNDSMLAGVRAISTPFGQASGGSGEIARNVRGELLAYDRWRPLWEHSG